MGGALAASRAYDDGRVAETPVDDLVAFAFECWPEARRMPIYHTLQMRRFIGPRAMSHLARFMIPQRGVRFLAESRDRYDNVWEAAAAVTRPGRQAVRFA